MNKEEEPRNPWSGSQYFRRLMCTGSGEAERGLPEVPEEIDYSTSRVAVHAASCDPSLVEELETEEDKETAKATAISYKMLSNWAVDNGGHYGYERRVKVVDSKGLVIATGQMDFYAETASRAVIFDLKGGWVADFGFWKTQGTIYGLGLLQEWENLESVELRFRHSIKNKDYIFHIHRGDMPRLIRQYSTAFRRKYYERLTLRAGPWCRWCKARNHCPALRANAHRVELAAVHENLEPLPAADLNRLYEQAITVEIYVKAVKQTMKQRAGEDEPDPALAWFLDSTQGAREISDVPKFWAVLKESGATAESFYKGLKVVVGPSAKAWVAEHRGDYDSIKAATAAFWELVGRAGLVTRGNERKSLKKKP